MAFLAIVCGVSWAGDATVPINLSVIDDKNQPVAQARIELRTGDQLQSSVSTNAAGKGTVNVHGAGSYLVTVSKTGYVSNQTSLDIHAGDAAQNLDMVLTPAALSQQNMTVEATASSPVTEQAAPPQATLTGTQAKETTSKPATVIDALPLIPGIVRAKDGSVRIAGYGENHSTMLVNSVDVTDPATGGFGLSVPIDSVETVSVSEMPYLAQYGRFTAGVVTAETRRGGDKWDFSLNDPLPEFRIRSGHLDGLKSATPRLNLSGPIIKNKLYFLEGAEYAINKQSVRTLPFPDNQITSTAINSFTQIDAILSPTQTLTASFHFAPHSVQYAGLDFFNPQPVTPNATIHEATGTILDRMSFAGGILQSTVALTRDSSGIRPQGTADMVLTPTGNLGNYFSQESRRATRFEWIENWAPRAWHFAGTHNFQFGSVVARSENEGQFHARPVQIEDASGHLLQHIDYTGGNSFALSDVEPALYAQDHWVLNQHFAIDGGLRVEAQTITHTTRTAPRAGFVWSPDQGGKTVVRGGVGVFYDSVPLDVYAFGSYPQQLITTYNTAGAVIDGPRLFMNVTDQAAQSRFPFIDRSRTSGNFAPYSVAWDVELERAINHMLMVRVKYLQSHAQDVITIEPRQLQGQDALVLGSSGSARTRQLELTARIGGESKRQFLFSYVRQRARGDVNDAASYLGDFPFPVVRQGLNASLPSELPNRFLLWGTYSLPGKIRLMPHLEVRNGFPYQPTNVLQQYIAASAGPQYRFPRYMSFDLRVSKDFQITKKHAIRLSGTVMNLTNHFNPLEVHSNIADSAYGTFFGNYNRKFLLDFDFLY